MSRGFPPEAVRSQTSRLVEGERRYEPSNLLPIDLAGAQTRQQQPIRGPGGVLAGHLGEARR